MKYALSLCVILASLSASSLAAKKVPWDLPNSMKVGKKELVLNGVGMRTATWFKVKVYAAGLYVPQKAKTTEKIMAMEGPKVISLYFLRDVGKDKISNAWKEAPGLDKFPQEVTLLNSYMSEMKKDTLGLEFQIHGDGLVVKVNGAAKPKITNKAFADALLNVYLGPKPPNAELKSGMLGQG